MKANKITAILGIIVFMVAIVGAIKMGGRIMTFIFIPAGFLVVLVAGGLGLACYRGGGLLGYAEACKKHFISAGILGTIIGIIQMLAHLEDPSAWGRGAAVALLSVFYGVVLYCISDVLVAQAREVGRE